MITIDSNSKRIDIESLKDDIIRQKEYLKRNNSRSVLYRDFGDFQKLNTLLISLAGMYIPQTSIFIDQKKSTEESNKHNSKVLQDYYNFIIQNKKLIMTMLGNYHDFLDYIYLMDLSYAKRLRTFPEKEFFDIILEFFSLFGDNAVKSVNNILNNNRIETNVPDSEGYCSAVYTSKLLGKCYVTSTLKEYDTCSLLSISHEFGHVFEYDNIIFPQRKEYPIAKQFGIEFSSCFFELEMAEFLKRNHIDANNIDPFINDRLLLLDGCYDTFEETFDVKNGSIELNGDLIDTDKNKRIPLRDAYVYGFGYYFALHLCELYEQNPNEFMKLLNNLLSARSILSIEELIELLGFDIDEFTNTKLIQPRILKLSNEMKKKYNIIL